MAKRSVPKSFRLSDEASELLEALVVDLGMPYTQTSVVELALRALAEQRGLRKPAKKAK